MRIELAPKHATRAAAVLWLVLIASIILRGQSTIHDGGGDFRGYAEVGQLVLDGTDPYATLDIGTNTWPPLFSVLAVPLGFGMKAAPTLTMATWLALMVACLYGCLYLAVRLVYRRPLSLRSRAGAIPITSAAALVPALLTWRYVLKNVRWLQVNPLILLLVLAGAYLIVRNRQRLGGALVGASAALKVLPVLFVPYFALKRWWPATLATLAAGALLTAAPALVFGPAGAWRHSLTWIERTRSIPVPVDWGSHSLLAMVDRYVGHRVLAHPELLSSDVPLMATGDPLVAAIVVILVVGLVGLFASAARRSGRDAGDPAVTVEIAMLLVLIPLFSPNKSWTTYFLFTLLAHVVLWRAATQPLGTSGNPGLSGGERRTLRLLLGVSVVLGLLESASVVGSDMARRLQMLSLLTFSALVLFGALLYLHRIVRRRGLWLVAESGSAPEPPEAGTSAYQSFSTTGSR